LGTMIKVSFVIAKFDSENRKLQTGDPALSTFWKVLFLISKVKASRS